MTNPKYDARALLLPALPATQQQIRQKTKMSQAAVSRWCIFLRECNELHIGAWLPPTKGGPALAVYHAGPGPDAVNELRMRSKAERRKAAQLLRPELDGVEKLYTRPAMKLTDWRTMPIRRDPFTAAFFGAAA
jgi:hypothetical protein